MIKSPIHSRKRIAASQPVERLIHVIRGQKVMLDGDLAALYEVPIDRLAHEVKDMKALPPVTKRRIGFRLGEDD